MTDNQNKVQNNNILVDLIIKSSRLQTLLNMLIDVNNAADFPASDLMITSKQYTELQDLLIKCINQLGDLVVLETNKFKEAVNGGQQTNNQENIANGPNPDDYNI